MKLLCILPFDMLCVSAIRMIFVKILLAVCMVVGNAVRVKADVLGKLCPILFFVVCKCSSVLLQSIVMSFVYCGDDGQVVR